MANPGIPRPVRDKHPLIQRAYMASEVNQGSHMHAEMIERVVMATLDWVEYHLRYIDWQEDTAAEAVAALRDRMSEKRSSMEDQ